ncbi:hypothetical protein M378DRAFT_68936 [Amanita muscaria Koide BX008]|uniref:P/Homo B domain-containing protein n=1 Tax=Amanita muscaria (strain Koide BX008) TaxID=946122 RepID=A0A0C2XK03_AMAMK|nr:hypothetical protein M378DRAFT_68936 [Amanita muscaria Koide BX008]
MFLPFSLLLALLVHGTSVLAKPAKRYYNTHFYYVLEHDPRISAGPSLNEVAQALGVEIVEQVGELQDHWLVRTQKFSLDLGIRSGEPEDLVLRNYEELHQIAKRESSIAKRSEVEHAVRIVSSIKYFSKQTLRRREKRAPPLIRPPSASAQYGVAEHLGINDPLFKSQWHLVNEEFPEHMMNVTGIWAMGYTGKGVITSLLDDGLDYDHEDIAANFDADDSHDFNDHEHLPTPKLSDDRHGTRCAGQIAGVKNDVCGVGIAYESKVAGVRILSGPISDVDEAAALNYGFQNVSIYSCSWGPPDNGRSMEGPNHLVTKAVLNGINLGRGGKGSVFVFASGNGGGYGDQCNFDGYTNSIYSVTVASVDYKGLHPYYSEACAANMIVAYSSGSGQHIVTTDRGGNKCTRSHGGTSAAAPNAVGVFALALEVRPDLTWRDIQYLCVETARTVNPEDPDWERTASGRLYSYKYGFGALDGYKYVTAAQTWKLVKPQTWLQTKTIQLGNGKMDDDGYSGGQFIAPGGITSKTSITKEMLTENNFESLEHITIKVWIDHARRGDVEVAIVSPNGIKSILAGSRSHDSADTGYPGWTFMSVKHWGENPIGDWTIRVSDVEKEDQNGTFLGWHMILWGSAIDPVKTTKLTLTHTEDVFPPKESPSLAVAPSATKTHPRPTAHLPGDHGSAEGENSNPAFATGKPSSTATPSGISAPDEGWFSDMSQLISSQKWFFGAISIVILFGIGAGIYFWRRHVNRKRRTAYTTLSATEEVTMTPLGTGRGGPRPRDGARSARTRQLYDAFGEVSDDEDADEHTNLRAGPRERSSPVGIGFHSGFLDDDDPTTAPALTPATGYRDEPDEEDRAAEEVPRDAQARASGAASPSGSGGSWEHASRSD